MHATWDLTSSQVVAAGAHLVLRVFAGREPVGAFREVVLGVSARSAFVTVEEPGQWYVATLGFHDASMRWQDLAQSAPVRTPILTSREARPEEFVMLTLPLEPEGEGAPRAVEPVSAGPLAQPEPVPLPPAAAASAPPPVLTGELHRQAGPERPPLGEPAAVTRLEAKPSGAVPPSTLRLKVAPAPPWTPTQARAMATALAALARDVGHGSVELAAAQRVCAAPEQQVPVGPGSPTAPFGGEGRPAAIPSSGAPLAPGAARRFWFNINAELIVYGATEPDAIVVVDGQTIALRPDGSFTLRFAVPDGEYTMEATATAAGGAEQRHVRLQFARRTHYRGAVGPHPADPTLRAPVAAPATTR